MKKLLVFGLIALFASYSFAHVTQDEEYILNSQMGSAAQKVQLGTLLTKTRNLLVAKYSYAVQGGSTSADINLITDLRNAKSYAKLPGKAIVTNAFLEVLTAPVILGTTATTNFSIKVKSSADLLASTAGPQFFAGHIVQGVPAGTTVTAIKLATGSSIVKMTISSVQQTSGITAGKWNLYIEYVLGD